MPHVLVDEMQRLADDGDEPELMFMPLTNLLRSAVEVVVVAAGNRVAMPFRPRAGEWLYVAFQADSLLLEELSASQYLAIKESLVDGMSYQVLVGCVCVCVCVCVVCVCVCVDWGACCLGGADDVAARRRPKIERAATHN